MPTRLFVTSFKRVNYLATFCAISKIHLENLILSIIASRALLLSSRKNLFVSAVLKNSACESSSISLNQIFECIPIKVNHCHFIEKGYVHLLDRRFSPYG